MLSILVTGVEKSGTTAVFAALAHRYSDKAVAFLEPSAPDQPNVARVMRSDRFHTITKIVLKAEISSDVINSADLILATVRDPRDVIVSWLPFKAVSNPTLASKTDLVDELSRAFERKSSGDKTVDVTHIEQIYQRHNVAMPSIQAYVDAYQRLATLAKNPHCIIERFEDFAVTGKSSDKISEPLKFELVPLSGDIAVNQRAGRPGEWKKWFSDRDVDRFAPSLDPFVIQHEYPAWDARGPGVIERSEYGGYLERATAAQAKLTSNARHWVATFSDKKMPLFGTLKNRNAYNDADFTTKLEERAANGNLRAIKELAAAVDAGYYPATSFAAKNAQEIDAIISGTPNA